VAHQADALLETLFERLHETPDPLEAIEVEQRIWEIWLVSGEVEIDRRMRRSLRAMNARRYDVARAALDEAIRAAPDYAEGWNKRATLFYLMGDFDSSVEDIDRVLALEPRHFGALSGLALIRERQGRPFEALEALEKVMRIHPHLPHLQQRIDRLTEQLGEPI